jgi:hypothetical protein
VLDPDGTCHGIGVILDGKGGKQRCPYDRSRGARYNSTRRYYYACQLKDSNHCFAIVISEDGMVDTFPPVYDRDEDRWPRHPVLRDTSPTSRNQP